MRESKHGTKTHKKTHKTADVPPTLGVHTEANITQKMTTNVVKNDYQNQMKEGKNVKKTHKKHTLNRKNHFIKHSKTAGCSTTYTKCAHGHTRNGRRTTRTECANRR